MIRFIILTGFVLIINSCRTTTSFDVLTEIKFSNTTDDTFRIDFFRYRTLVRNFEVLPKSTQTFTNTLENGPTNPSQFLDSDSAIIKIKNKKVLYAWYRKQATSKDILQISGYNENKVSERKFIYTYFLSEEHKDSAR